MALGFPKRETLGAIARESPYRSLRNASNPILGIPISFSYGRAYLQSARPVIMGYVQSITGGFRALWPVVIGHLILLGGPG